MKTEDISKRTEFSKTFVEDDGTRTIVSGQNRIHYDDNGQMVEFAPQWIEGADSITLTGAHFDAMISKGTLAYRFGKRDENKKIDVRIISVNGDESPPFNFTDVMLDKNRVGFRNFLPDFDVYWVAHGHGLTLHKILRSDAAPRQFVWDVLKDKNIKANLGDRFRRGRENIDDVVQREIYADQHRQLELESNVNKRPNVGGRDHAILSERWTGNVIGVQKGTRLKYVTTDFAYPVRMV